MKDRDEIEESGVGVGWAKVEIKDDGAMVGGDLEEGEVIVTV